MLNMQILHGAELARYFVPRDELEAHLLSELRAALDELSETQNATERDTAELTDKLQTLRNVLDDAGLPFDPDELHVALNELSEAQDATERDTTELTDKLQTLRNVLDDLALPTDPDELHAALCHTERLAIMLAEALET